MIDYHQALTMDSIERQRLNITTPGVFKKDVLLSETTHAYENKVDCWMFPKTIPLQAIPIRHGTYREIVVLPMFTESWFLNARKKTFSVPPIWSLCKSVNFLLTEKVRRPGAKFPRRPFVILLDPNTRIGDADEVKMFTPNANVHIEGVSVIYPDTITSNAEMLTAVKNGEQNGLTLRICRETMKNNQERWFWEPISYFSEMRLVSVDYSTGKLPTYTLYGEIDGKLLTLKMHRASEEFTDILSRFVSEYINAKLLIRYPLEGSISELGEDAIMNGCICGPSNENIPVECNRMITY